MKINQLLESLNQQQRSVPQLPATFRPKKISVLNNPTDPRHPMTGYAVGANESAGREDPYDQGWYTGHRAGQDETACPYKPGTAEHAQWMAGYEEAQAQPRHYDESIKEDITKEDIISKLKDRLGDYLSDISKEIKKDPDLIDKLATKAPSDQMGPPVKTVTTYDGHEIQIHGNEDDGFRISIKNKTANSKFKNLDEAVMACEMYCAQRRGSQDYLDEAGKDACYSKVKSRYKIWPSAYASGALVRCRKVGAANWGNKSKK